MNIETLIYAYLTICTSMIAFNCICIFTFKRSENNIGKKSVEFERRIEEQIVRMNQGFQPDEKHKEYLCKKLKKTGNLKALDETIERLLEKEPETVKNYLSIIYPVFNYLAMEYGKKDEIRAAYFSYVIRRFGILQNQSSGIIIETFFKMLHEPSIYCRENALQGIYSTGDCELVVRALKIIDSDGQFYHSKLLTDGLLAFAGSQKKLLSVIWETFDSFSIQMKVTVLNYFRFSTSECCEKMLQLLTDTEQNAEIRFSCIRYFGKYYYEPALQILLKLAENKKAQRWEYAAIASSALGLYPSKQTIEILKRNLNNSNWYIRFNASQSLEQFGLSYTDLIDVFDGSDRYAREILQYRLDQRNAKHKESKQREAASV